MSQAACALPKAAPPHSGEPLAVKSATEPAPEPGQQTAAAQAKPAEASAPPQSPAPAPAAVQAKPAEPQILPTREMPKVQDLE